MRRGEQGRHHDAVDFSPTRSIKRRGPGARGDDSSAAPTTVVPDVPIAAMLPSAVVPGRASPLARVVAAVPLIAVTAPDVVPTGPNVAVPRRRVLDDHLG